MFATKLVAKIIVYPTQTADFRLNCFDSAVARGINPATAFRRKYTVIHTLDEGVP